MNILALDFGTKRIGLSFAQTDLRVPLLFGIITDLSHKTKEEQISDLITEERIDILVIGMPYGLEEGNENANTARVRAFAERLKIHIAIPIEFVDERLSSWEADEMGGHVSRDEKSAMIIMSTYLDSLEP